MSPDRDPRPDPEALLRQAAQEGRGRLKVFLGAAPGVGKTYAMLAAAAAARAAGTDVVIGVVETHGRADTAARVAGFETVARRRLPHQGRMIEEMDLDALLARRPQLALVDELAHSNAPGSRHEKRYQDVEELLAAGIDVWSTVNVQHLESLNDVVASFTQVRVRETLPDRVIENAEIQVVDLPPDALIERLRAGKVYVPAEATRALDNFFSRTNLSALRELALRRAAQAIDAQLLDDLRARAAAGTWAAGERIVVAVGAQPGTDALVRAGKRLADALRGPWTVVHVETPHAPRPGSPAAARLAATMQLASQLGGQLATIPADSEVAGLARFAGEARATQLVIGTAARRRWWRVGASRTTADRLMRALPGVGLHLLPLGGTGGETAAGPDAATRGASAPPRGPGWGSVQGYGVAALLIALVTLLGVSLLSTGGVADVGLLYLIPVLVAATRYGLRTGLAAGIASSLAYNFFFLPPLYTFTIRDPANLVTLCVLLGVALVGSQLAARVRDQALLAQRSAAQSRALAGFARLLTRASDAEEIAALLCSEVARLFGVQTVVLLPEGARLAVTAALPPAPELGAIEQAAARWAMDHHRPAGRGSDTLTAAEWRFEPLGAGARTAGVFGLARADAGEPVRSDQLPLLLSLIDQAALALERVGVEAERATVRSLRERDRLRSTLLSSVSHDLRTPLTTIIGTLAEIAPADADQAAQLATARGEAERLRRFVANLLDMARIEAGGLRLRIEPVDLAEAVAAAVAALARPLARHRVEIAVAPDLPLAAVDPQLFHQCLINLLDNAAKFADPGGVIRIAARGEGSGLAIDVIDDGPGLPDGAAALFERFARVEGSDRKGGTGLGLAIVRGFAEAMGLGVSAADRSDARGACFTIHLPAERLRPADAAGEGAGA